MMPTSPARTSSVTLKLLAVGGMILFLLIPASMIDSLVSERLARRDAAVEEIHAAWSHAQFLRGPILTVPVRVTRGHDKAGKPIYDLVETRFLPENLDIRGAIDTESRYRGIYKTVVYTAKLEMNGRFTPPNFAALNLGTYEILWDQSKVAFGVQDLRGIKDAVNLVWEGKPLAFEPGIAGVSELGSGLEAAVPGDGLRARKDVSFSIPLNIRGSKGLSFLPTGRTTTVSLRSSWPTPSFNGAFLPDSREIGAGGFSANWKVLHINRSLPSEWTGGADLEASRFGVDLLTPVDSYSSASRSTKYAVLFIFLTFLGFFLIEYFQSRRLHPVQYLMIGSALVLFYLLLLSLSEQIAFGAAYAVAGLAVIVMVTSYAQGVFRRRTVTSSVASILSALYVFLYVLLRLEDYALLLGSLGLFCALALVMYLTRGIDWYGIEASKEGEAPS